MESRWEKGVMSTSLQKTALVMIVLSRLTGIMDGKYDLLEHPAYISVDSP